jgi:tRNA-dihydrouridine synthase 3
MGLSGSFLQGAKTEWALTKRHESERTFGIQVAGSKPAQLVPCAEAIVKQCPDVDFVDVNLGCPIDLVFNKGAGSALFDHPSESYSCNDQQE